MQHPEILIIRLVQREVFDNEIKCLQSKKNLHNQSKLKGLYPFIDKLGILRVGGRLQNSDLNFSQKHPIILPSKHKVTTNIIRQAHSITLHGSEVEVLAYLRNKYHIP